MKILITTMVALGWAGWALAGDLVRGGDHHMHIHSENVTAVWTAMCDTMPGACGELTQGPPPLAATDAIQTLDEAGIEKGVILSTAYFFGVPELTGSEFDNYKLVRAENEYVARQVAYFPGSLVGFFSVNPLKEYAVHEVSYWAETGGLDGLKLHLANSDFKFDDEEHIAQLRAIFGVLNDYSLPVGIHLRNRNPEYGYKQADIFIEQVVKHAPNVTLHLAHMGGWGGWDEGTDGAVQAFLDAIERGDLDRDLVWFDLAAVVISQLPDEAYESLSGRLRDIGLDRVLFATDWPAREDPKAHIETLKSRLELTAEEWDVVLNNQAPYLQ